MKTSSGLIRLIAITALFPILLNLQPTYHYSPGQSNKPSLPIYREHSSQIDGPGLSRFTLPQDPVSPSQPEGVPSAIGIIKQFEETSFYINHTDFINPTLGWAVGLPHWDQAHGVYTGTILSTSDGGETWITQTAGLAASFNGVSFIDDLTGWVDGTEGTILHTTDGGQHWIKQVSPTEEDFRSIVFTNQSSGWIASVQIHSYDPWGDPEDWRASLWHTIDGGMSWEKQDLPGTPAIINRIDFVNENTGWAIGVKYTGDDIYGDPTHRAVIYHTSDGGGNWVEQAYAVEEARITFTAVDFIDPLNGWVVGFHHVFAAPEGVIYHTEDGGQTWERQGPNANLMDVNFLDGQRGYAVGFDYIGAQGPPVYRTLDGGTTWEKVIMRNNDLEGLYSVFVSEDRVIALGDYDLQATSIDPWGSYEPPFGENLFTQKYLNIHYTFEDVFFTDMLNGWAVGSRSFLPIHTGQVIFHTNDGGLTWETKYEQPPPLEQLFSYFRLDSVFFLNDQTGWAVGMPEYDESYQTRWAILYTEDGGESWQERGAELQVDLEPEFFDVQFLDDQNGWLLNDSHYDPDTGQMTIYLARTQDGGNTWEWVNTHLPGSLSVGFTLVQGGLDFVDPQNAWAVGGLGEVVHTSDSGSSWFTQTLTCDWPICVKRLFDVDFIDTQEGWIAGEGVYYTNDGGNRWEMLPTGSNVDFHDIQFLDSDNGWLAGDKGTVLYTDNRGENWKTVNNQVSSAYLKGMHFIDSKKGWFVGSNGTILTTVELPVKMIY